jgi:ABC-type nitrate/sulfonate/bicarbonate transport system substrate-binding protein
VVLAGVLWLLAGVAFLFHIRKPEPARSTTTTVTKTGQALFAGPLNPEYGGEIVGRVVPDGVDTSNLRSGQRAQDVLASLSSGKTAFALVNSIDYLLAKTKGAPLVAFGAGIVETPVVFYALEKSGIRTPADFVGARVARKAGSDTAIVYDAVLRSVGIARSQVKEISGRVGVSDLIDGKIDVLPGHAGKEAYLLHLKGIPYNVIRASEYGIHIPGTVYVTSTRRTQEQPSSVQTFLGSAITGWSAVYTNSRTSVAIVARAIGSDPQQVEFELSTLRDSVIPDRRRIGEFDDLQWRQLLTILIGEGLVKASADLYGAVDYRFLREAYRVPISAAH